jgi:hypothetical protein
MSAADKTKLNGIAVGAEVNQNAFSNIKVGSSTISADSKTDTLEIAAGTGITITTDTTNDKITINGINQYTHPNHTGDVTSIGDSVTTISNNVVTNAKLADMASNTVKGRKSSSAGDPEDISISDLKYMLALNNVTNEAQIPLSQKGVPNGVAELDASGKVPSSITGNADGNAATATKLQTARTISITGDVTGSASFDGSADISISATVADDSHNHVISNIDNLQTTLDSKAPLASPAFTGTPTAPTAPNGTNTDQIATTKFVQNTLSAGGYGDMLKSQYDTNNNGIVDRAEVADSILWTNITNKPTFANVATSGSYNDLTDKPTSLPANGGNADTIDGKHYSDITNYVASRGENLVTNGTGLLGNNTNFSAFTFDGSDAYFTKGSFKDSSYNSVRFNDEIMPVDVNRKYKLSVYAKTNPYVGAKYYIGIAEFDCDGNAIQASHHMYYSGTLTTLAQDLKPGDTVVYLTSAQNWKNAQGSYTHQRSIIFWGYKNSNGYEYPPETYSRYHSGYDIWLDGAVDYVNNCITLKNPWSYTNPNDPQGIWRAGTKLSNGSSGSTYKYITSCVNTAIPNAWTNYVGYISGIDNTGNNDSTKFSHGTAGIKLLFLNNRDVTGSTVWYSNISFGLDVALISDIPTKTSQLTNDANFINSPYYIGTTPPANTNLLWIDIN